MNSKLYLLFIIPVVLMVVLACKSKESTDSNEPVLTPVVHPEWSHNATIYEVNVRQYSEEGTFAAFQEHLPRLKAMGVKILWLMPIHPIGELNRKGSLGSYYSVRDYRAVNPEFGTMDDFKALVDAVHAQGMYLILDWVANHCAWDNALLTEHPDWFTRDSLGNMIPPVPDWTDVVDFNFDNHELWDYMIESMKFWITECDVDGFRCDVAGMVPIEFWQQVRPALDAVKPVFMLAEDEQPIEHTAFDMTYGWDLMHNMNAIYAGNETAANTAEYFRQHPHRYGSDDYRMYFITNHDENSWNGTVQERMGDGAMAFAVLAAMAPGMPMVYSGQEAGLNKRLEFFEHDPIEWVDSEWKPFYSKLLNLNLDNPACWNGDAGGEFTLLENNHADYVLSFQQKKDDSVVITIVNLSTQTRTVNTTGIPEGDYTELFSEVSSSPTEMQSIDLNGWDYRVFVKM